VNPLFLDALEVLGSEIADELRQDRMTRAELMELAQLSWRQLEPGACLGLGTTEDVLPFLRCPGFAEGVLVVEHLCSGEAPPRPGWLEWLATLLACFVLLWDTDPYLTRPHSHPLCLFGREWVFPENEPGKGV
jgi:hypothetical protein